MTNYSIAPEVSSSTISLRLLPLPQALAEIAGPGFAEIDLGALPGICDHGSMDREYTEFGLDPDLCARGRVLDERLARLTELWSQWGAPIPRRARADALRPP